MHANSPPYTVWALASTCPVLHTGEKDMSFATNCVMMILPAALMTIQPRIMINNIIIMRPPNTVVDAQTVHAVNGQVPCCWRRKHRSDNRLIPALTLHSRDC